MQSDEKQRKSRRRRGTRYIAGWMRGMHGKIFNCQVTGVTFFLNRGGSRGGCGGYTHGERRLREENVARNPWKLPPRLTHDAKSLNFTAFPLAPFPDDEKNKRQKRMSITAFRFLFHSQDSRDTWHLPKTVIRIRKHVSCARENESLLYANIFAKMLPLMLFRNIPILLIIFREIYFFYREIYLRRAIFISIFHVSHFIFILYSILEFFA